MGSRYILVALLVVLLAVGVRWLAKRSPAGAPKVFAASTVRQQVELTVYAQDFGMVREMRPVGLQKGTNRMSVADVSKELDPHSVLLRWQANTPNLPQLVSHTYDLGATDSNAVLKRYVGKELELVRYGENGREAERQRGTLMVAGNDEVVMQMENQLYVRPVGTIVAPANGEVVTIPQLSVHTESPSAKTADLEVAYLTRGLSWSADYVATLLPQSDSLALECWATVTNLTGIDYPNAKVSLIAGTPNRAVLPAEARFGGEYAQDITITATAGLQSGPRHPLVGRLECLKRLETFTFIP